MKRRCATAKRIAPLRVPRNETVLLLDTDHLTVLRYQEHSLHQQLLDRLRSSPDKRIVVCVISLEEQLRGWLAEIRRRVADPLKQIPIYLQLTELIEFFRDWDVLPFDEQSAVAYQSLKDAKIRVGSQDLKIAAIALSQSATLLSSNLNDFERVPGLAVEDWLYGKTKGS